MRIFYGLPSESNRTPCAVAIGNFDGVHKGHQVLIGKVLDIATQRNLVPAVLTFEPHPKEFFAKTPEDVPARILSLRDKVEAFGALGIQRVFILRFNQRLAGLSPEEFAKKILAVGLDAKAVVVGANFHFGSKGAGDTETLTKLGKKLGFTVDALTLHNSGEKPVSSSRIREALEKGNLKAAEEMLGRPYVVTGKVRKGKQLGRTIGFPTINQRILPPTCHAHPAVRGVYAVKVHGADSKPREGVACIGRRPTVTENGEYLLETYIFDWDKNLYGKPLTVEFFSKIRDEKKFHGLEELKRAIHQDMEDAREYFKKGGIKS